MTPLIREMVKYAPEPESAMWFDVGSMRSMDAARVTADFLFNLPFSKTAIAGTDKDGIKFVLWLMEGESSLTIAGFTVLPKGISYIKPTAIVAVDGSFRYYIKDQEVAAEEVKSLARMTVACLLRVQNMDTVYQPSIQKSVINVARKRKGKPPLISWHTVKIELRKAKNESQGGTHASPRLHDRRGHWRRYKSGKTIFVKACKVGDASKGMVFKDYQASPTLRQQS